MPSFLFFSGFRSLARKSSREGIVIRFQDMPYRRVTYEEVEQRYGELIRDMQAAPAGADCLEVLRRRGQLLGLPGYTELSYRLMCRIGYGPEDVRRFREQVKRYLVPLWPTWRPARPTATRNPPLRP